MSLHDLSHSREALRLASVARVMALRCDALDAPNLAAAFRLVALDFDSDARIAERTAA